MVRLKKPSPQFWLRISPCVIYIECISAGLSSGSEGYSREKSLRFELEGLPCCFICILRCALDVHYKKEKKKKVPLRQIVWGCFCPVESWLRSEADSHFKRPGNCCMSRSIRRTGLCKSSARSLWSRTLTLVKLPLNCHLSCQTHNKQCTGHVAWQEQYH